MNPIKIFLTSAICVCIFMPAIADIAVDSETPSCDYSTVGATSGNTSLEAIWNIVNSTCAAGQYFDMSTATCVTCTAGNFCPGGTYNVESETNGLNACPTGFVQSGAGASANTDCYRSCTTNDVAHSTAVNGEYYYGDTNMCGATACDTGYHTELISLPNTHPFTNIEHDGKGSRKAKNLDGYTWNMSASAAAGVENGYFQASLSYGLVKGMALCSITNGRYGNVGTPDETNDEDALYCWCKLTEYTHNGITHNLNGRWVFHHYRTDCRHQCADICAFDLTIYKAFAQALYSASNVTVSRCSANTININWYNQNEIYDQNSCTYDDTVTLPDEPTRTGYTFDGWAVKVTE